MFVGDVASTNGCPRYIPPNIPEELLDAGGIYVCAFDVGMCMIVGDATMMGLDIIISTGVCIVLCMGGV